MLTATETDPEGNATGCPTISRCGDVGRADHRFVDPGDTQHLLVVPRPQLDDRPGRRLRIGHQVLLDHDMGVEDPVEILVGVVHAVEQELLGLTVEGDPVGLAVRLLQRGADVLAEQGPGLRTDDAVRRQPVGRLERTDRLVGAGAEVAVGVDWHPPRRQRPLGVGHDAPRGAQSEGQSGPLGVVRARRRRRDRGR